MVKEVLRDPPLQPVQRERQEGKEGLRERGGSGVILHLHESVWRISVKVGKTEPSEGQRERLDWFR